MLCADGLGPSSGLNYLKIIYTSLVVPHHSAISLSPRNDNECKITHVIIKSLPIAAKGVSGQVSNRWIRRNCTAFQTQPRSAPPYAQYGVMCPIMLAQSQQTLVASKEPLYVLGIFTVLVVYVWWFRGDEANRSGSRDQLCNNLRVLCSKSLGDHALWRGHKHHQFYNKGGMTSQEHCP